MQSLHALKAKRKLENQVRASADAIASLVNADPEKVRVMAYFRDLVAKGYATWTTLENGDIQLRLCTGETYLLANTAITRIA